MAAGRAAIFIFMARASSGSVVGEGCSRLIDTLKSVWKVKEKNQSQIHFDTKRISNDKDHSKYPDH